MKVSIQTVKHGRFALLVQPETDVASFRQQIVQHLSASQIHLPAEQHLTFRGRIIPDKKSIQELGIVDSDTLLFLYDLEAKVVKPLGPTDTKPVEENLAENPHHDYLNHLDGQNLDNFPFPDPEQLETITMMGFTKFVAQKALIVNRFDPEMATEWILTNMEDPSLYDPLPTDILKSAFHYLFPDVEKSVTQQIKKCVRENKCTILATKQNFEKQPWFKCFTCGFVDNQGICESCANVCHKGHNISPDQSVVHNSGFYCDCGLEPSCKCNT